MTDRHTPRRERKPKPVKLSPPPWETPQVGKSPVTGVTIPKTQEGPSAGRKMGKSA